MSSSHYAPSGVAHNECHILGIIRLHLADNQNIRDIENGNGISRRLQVAELNVVLAQEL